MSNYSVLIRSAISEDRDIIDVSDTLQHSQHEGYYSPNNTANKATPYIFDTVVKSSDGRQIGMKFKGTGDREWVIIYVPSTDFTPTYNNVIKLINDNKDVSNRKVVIRENEKAKAARIVTNFFNSPSISGNEKMTSYVKKPQYLKHSEDLDVIDANDMLQHGVTVQQIRRSYVYKKAEMNYNGYTMGSRKVPYVKAWFTTTEKPMDAKMTPDPYYAIIDVEHIPLNGNRAAAIKTELKKYFDQYMQLISDSELNKATYGMLEVVNPIMNDRANDVTHRPQHAGYYSPNLRVRHSLFTEVYDMDDYLEHHGILGMKWGVRRYQNEDGSLTEAGRKRYINKKYKQSRTTFEKELNEKLEGKSKEERTKIIRQESRDLAEAAANRANTNTKKMIGTGAVGGTAAGIAGGIFGGPLGAFVGAYAGAVASTVFSSIAITLGEQFLYSERNRAKDNLLNMKYDEINIDEETKRRLNL